MTRFLPLHSKNKSSGFLVALLFGLSLLVPSCNARGFRGTGSTTTSSNSTTTTSSSLPRHLHDTATYQSEVERRMAILQGPNSPETATSTADVVCQDELLVEIVCQESDSVCQDFSSKRGSCESKMFKYHGGPCRDATTTTTTTGSNSSSTDRRPASLPMARQPFLDTDTAAECQDYHGGPPSLPGLAVFVVISDPINPLVNSSMWTTVGDYMWTDYHDFPVGHPGLSDVQNITIYSSDIEPSFDTMLQTMLFWAPCEGQSHNYLNTLDRGQSVQLIGTAVDPTITANFEVRVSSQKADQAWQLQRVTMATSVSPPYEVLDVPARTRSMTLPSSSVSSTTTTTTTTSGTDGYISVPYQVEMDRSEHLTILSTVHVVNQATGVQCHVSGLFDAPPTTTTNVTTSSPTLSSNTTSQPFLPSTSGQP